MFRSKRLPYSLSAAILGLGLFLMIASGCERHITSRDADRLDLTDLPKIVNPSATLNNEAITLTWQSDDTTTILRFRIYVADSTQSEYKIVDSTTGVQFTKSVQYLGLNRLYFFKISAVITGGTEGELSTAIGARFAFMSISVNGESDYANSRDVLVSVDAPLAVTHTALSEDSLLTGAGFKPFSGQAAFKLSEGDGLKTVYGRLQFADGTQSDILKAKSITLDTRATIDSITFTPKTSLSPGATVTFRIYAREGGGEAFVTCPGIDDIELFDNGSSADGDATANDGIYSALWVIPISTSIINGIVTAEFRDAALNVAVAKQATAALNVFSPPLPVTAAALALSTFQIQITWTRADSASFASYRIYRSSTPNVTTASTLIASITTRTLQIFTDSTLNENTTAYYRIFVFDNSGLNSGSNEVSATTQVNTAPAQVDFFATKNVDTTISLTWTVSPDVDFQSYRIYRSTTPTVTTSSELVGAITSRGITSYLTDFDSPPVTTYFRIFVFDRHGLSTGSVVQSVSP